MFKYHFLKYKTPDPFRVRGFVVPLAGLEPARMLLRGILSPLRLPIPPQRHLDKYLIKNSACYSAEF